MMITETTSIRLRLTLWLILPLTFLSLTTLIVMSYLITNKAIKVFDHGLLAAANSIEQHLSVRSGQIYLHKPYFFLDIMESVSGEKIFYRIERSDGEILAGFRGLKMPEEQKNGDEPVFYNTEFAGNELRAVYLPVFENTQEEGGYTHIILAESLHGRSAFTNDILLILVGVTLLGGILSILASVFAVNRGLTPLRAIQQSLIKRSADDLAPIKESVPKEVIELVGGINSLMGRVRKGIKHIQHFNSDVSHQLRIPLAEIKTLAETSKQEPDQQIKNTSLQKIEDLTDFLARTTQQLLTYSKTSSSVLDNSDLETLNLTELCQRVTSQLAPKMYKLGHELAFVEQTKEKCHIMGDPVMLEGLLVNLIENASLYAVDQQNQAYGVITVRTNMRNNRVVLEVEDQGPGIPEHLLSEVTQRFYRLDTTHRGSGLGLAIVRQISDFHRAKMELCNVKPHGLKVTIGFLPA